MAEPSAPPLQGILLVYDITNRWSFDGIDRWIKEIDEVGVHLQTLLPGPPPSGAPHICPSCGPSSVHLSSTDRHGT